MLARHPDGADISKVEGTPESEVKSVVCLSGSSCILDVIPRLEADNRDLVDDNPGEGGQIMILG
jgi:hypothetical protein